MSNRWLLNGLGAAFCIALVATSLRQDTHAAGPERPFKAYAPFIARDEGVAVPSGGPVPVATAVGVPTGTATSATIGADGGSLSAPNGKLVLTIPAGALASDTVISIQPITNLAPGRIGGAYRLTPNGQTFLKPITLTFAYTDRDVLRTSADFLGAAFQTADRYWQWIGDATVDTTAKTASVTISHFTDVSQVAGFQIRPPSKTVKPNGRVSLQIVDCYRFRSSEPRGYDCDSDELLAILNPVTDWSVNGVAGGGEATGTVAGSGPEATYTAPATTPIPNHPVAVSARVAGVLVVSNITIAEDSWTGTGASAVSSVQSATADVTWILESIDSHNVATYRPSGIASFVVKGCSINPAIHVIDSSTDGNLIIDYNATPPTYHGIGVTQWTGSWLCRPSRDAYSANTVAPFFGGSKGAYGVEAKGEVSPDGTTIEGTDTDPVGLLSFTWHFTRDR